jgi:hypothetical protein
MAQAPATNQVDVTPATGPAGLNIHFHGPAGNSASGFNNPADFPAPAKSGTQVTAKIAQGNGGPRFSNPA